MGICDGKLEFHQSVARDCRRDQLQWELFLADDAWAKADNGQAVGNLARSGRSVSIVNAQQYGPISEGSWGNNGSNTLHYDMLMTTTNDQTTYYARIGNLQASAV